jgi:sodium-dependent dicarboxylate transporter 2/3/5
MSNRQFPTVKNGYFIKVLIGLLITALFWFLPPFSLLTPAGMKVMGLFIMVIYFCIFNEFAWPGILAVVGMSFILKEIYPATTDNALYRTIELSWGYWMIPFMIANLFITFALSKTGFMRRLAVWLLSFKFAKRSPWTFTFTIIFAALFLGLWFDPIATVVFSLGFAKEIFERLGYKKGDSWPSVVIIGIAFSISIAFGMTPVSHSLPILALGVYQNMTGASINFFTYMSLGIPVGAVCFFGLLVFLRFFTKPDMSRIKDADLSMVIGERLGPMTKREKITILIALCVFVCWLLAGLLNVVAARSQLTLFFNKITIVMPAIIGVMLLAMIKIDGEPLMNFEFGMRNGITWNVVMLLAALFMLGNGFSQQATGFNDTISGFLSPFFNSGLSSFAIMFIMITVIIILTNFLNNIPVVMLLLSVGIPLAPFIGLSPLSIALLITIAGEMAFASPSSFGIIAFIYGDEWAEPKRIFKYGLVIMFWSIIVVGLLGLPLAKVLFG